MRIFALTVLAGDTIIIPAGVGHWYSSLESTVDIWSCASIRTGRFRSSKPGGAHENVCQSAARVFNRWRFGRPAVLTAGPSFETRRHRERIRTVEEVAVKLGPLGKRR